jgi:hypothetical protein
MEGFLHHIFMTMPRYGNRAFIVFWIKTKKQEGNPIKPIKPINPIKKQQVK